jgi:hypothetical protein
MLAPLPTAILSVPSGSRSAATSYLCHPTLTALPFPATPRSSPPSRIACSPYGRATPREGRSRRRGAACAVRQEWASGEPPRWRICHCRSVQDSPSSGRTASCVSVFPHLPPTIRSRNVDRSRARRRRFVRAEKHPRRAGREGVIGADFRSRRPHGGLVRADMGPPPGKRLSPSAAAAAANDGAATRALARIATTNSTTLPRARACLKAPASSSPVGERLCT